MSANQDQITSLKLESKLSQHQIGSLTACDSIHDSTHAKREFINGGQQKRKLKKCLSKNDSKANKDSNQGLYQTRLGFRKKQTKEVQFKKSSSFDNSKVNDQSDSGEIMQRCSKKQDQKQLDLYLKIVEYLKKIEWDKTTSIHKMNPFQYLTPSCFWFWICAQYFSLNMGFKKSINIAVQDVMAKVQRIRFPIPNRLGKSIHFHRSQLHLLQFETEQLKAECQPIVQILNDCIPQNRYHAYIDSIEKIPQITEIAQDNSFRSTLRVSIYNYVKKNCIGHIQNLLEQKTIELNKKLLKSNENAQTQMIIEGQEEKGKQDNKMQIQEDKSKEPSIRGQIQQVKLCYSEEDLLLDTILHLPLEKIISILESEIQEVKLPYIEDYVIPLSNDPFELISPPHSYENKFLDYLRVQKQKETNSNQNVQQPIINTLQQNVVEDVKCQVCTDGDYTDDNLIVFCATCNISVHQRCVNLAKVPAQSWICQVCHAFGPQGRFLPCPLCNVKGGALKRTTIPSQTIMFKDKNPSYHEYLRCCPQTKIKQQYHIPSREQNTDIKLFYDYYDTTPPTKIDLPKSTFVWMHYSCSIWVPQCYFEERGGHINIKGLDNVDRKRFKQMCEVCHTTKTGAAIKCAHEGCTNHYHPECARTSGVYMQQRHQQSLKYFIYCKAHQPLKLARVKQTKAKKSKDQIIKFCRGIQKYVETYKIASVPFKLLKPNKKIKLSKKEQRVKQIKQHRQNDNTDFIDKLKDFLVNGTKLVVSLKKVGDKAFKVIDIEEPSKHNLKSSISRIDEVWQCFTYKNLNPMQMYKKYKKIMKQMTDLKDKFCKDIKIQSKNDKRKDKRKHKQCQQAVVEEDPDQLYCVCQQKYIPGQLMMQCEVCDEWYHFKCIGFIGTQNDAGNVLFNCRQCEEYQDKQEIEERKQKYKDYYIPGFQMKNPQQIENMKDDQHELSDLSSESQNQQNQEQDSISENSSSNCKRIDFSPINSKGQEHNMNCQNISQQQGNQEPQSFISTVEKQNIAEIENSISIVQQKQQKMMIQN